MSTTTDRPPLSRANAVLLAVLAAGIVATLVLGLWSQAVLLVLMLLLGAIGIYRGRRPDAADVTRVDSLEYRDERDRRIARDGFAVVGVVALALAVVEFVLASVFLPEWALLVAAQLVVLCVVWGVANRVAARRH